MGKKFNKSRRGGHSSRGHLFRDFRGKSSARPRNLDNWKKTNSGNDANSAEKFEKVTLKEHQVGITEFVNTGKGFTGVVKARFSDFHVNEIDLDGTVLQLNDFTIPSPLDFNYIADDELETAKSKIADVISEDMWKEIDQIAKGERSEALEIDVTDFDKEKRTTIHKVIKKLHERCNSATVAKDGEKKFIRVTQVDKKANRRSQWCYPGEYVHFLIYKENMDTSEVAVTLANSLKVKPSQINYCGTKDKRGKTTQKFCVKRRHPSEIARAVKNIPSAQYGNFTFEEKVIKLGDLKGNRFRVVLRHVNGDRTEIEKSLQGIKECGFINYYGLQRFGNNASIPTYEVGIALLKSDYKTACELILKPRDNDIHFMRSIREAWWKNRDSTAAAAMFHNNKFIEKKLLDGLSQYGENDYANALRKIPRNMLLLYTHAYQSLIFNRIASKRIKKHGLKPIVGDLVYRNKDELDQIALDTESDLNIDEDVTPESIDLKEEESSFKQQVKSLTEEDISSGKYKIFDVVLPLPGHDITYPSNEVAQWYEDILAEENLSSEKLKHNVKTFSLAGAYRKLLIQPQNMTWYFKKYNYPEEDVITSHIEKSNARKEVPEGTGKLTALVLDFCLPASVYATMFLREILKSDTSSTNQARIGRDELKKFEEKNSTEVSTENKEKAEDNASVSKETVEKRPSDVEGEPEVKRAKVDEK